MSVRPRLSDATSRPRTVICNMANTLGLVYGNVADDPSFFALQVIRKFKNPTLRRLFGYALKIPMDKKVRQAIRGMLAEDKRLIQDTAAAWLADPSRKKMAGLVIANISLAMHHWDDTRQILDLLGSGRSANRVQARLQWQLGNLEQAIATLAGTESSRQLQHYNSEFQVLTGWNPSLPVHAIHSARVDHRVLYFATNSLPYTGSGYAQRTHSILKSLQNSAWQPMAVTRISYPANIGHVTAGTLDTEDSVPYHRIYDFPARNDMRGRLQQQTDQLVKLVTSLQPAILHTTTDFSNALSVRAVSESTGLPWIYEVRGQLADTWASTRPESAQQSQRYTLFQAREVEMAQAADHVITLGKHMKANLVEAGVDEGKITVLPNGVGEKFLEEPVNRVSARSQLSLDPDVFYVGTVSSLVPYEGLDTLLRAVALIAPTQPQLRVLIVGDGTELQTLRDLAQILGIANLCYFPGRVPREQAHLYHSSLDIFVVPRKDLSVTRSVTPLKPVEALASGVPVLASNLPALQELVSDGENGHLIEAENVSAWAIAISDLINNPEKAVHMGRNGRDFVLRTRTWASNSQRLTDIYEDLINKAT